MARMAPVEAGVGVALRNSRLFGAKAVAEAMPALIDVALSRHPLVALSDVPGAPASIIAGVDRPTRRR